MILFVWSGTKFWPLLTRFSVRFPSQNCQRNPLKSSIDVGRRRPISSEVSRAKNQYVAKSATEIPFKMIYILHRFEKCLYNLSGTPASHVVPVAHSQKPICGQDCWRHHLSKKVHIAYGQHLDDSVVKGGVHQKMLKEKHRNSNSEWFLVPIVRNVKRRPS